MRSLVLILMLHVQPNTDKYELYLMALLKGFIGIKLWNVTTS